MTKNKIKIKMLNWQILQTASDRHKNAWRFNMLIVEREKWDSNVWGKPDILLYKCEENYLVICQTRPYLIKQMLITELCRCRLEDFPVPIQETNFRPNFSFSCVYSTDAHTVSCSSQYAEITYHRLFCQHKHVRPPPG